MTETAAHWIAAHSTRSALEDLHERVTALEHKGEHVGHEEKDPGDAGAGKPAAKSKHAGA